MANEYGFNYRAAPLAPVAGVAAPQTSAPAGPAELDPNLTGLRDLIAAKQKMQSAEDLRAQRYPARGWGNIGANAWNAFRAQRREKQGTELAEQAQLKAAAAKQLEEDQIYRYTYDTLIANHYTPQEADPIARLAAKGKDIKNFLHEKEKKDIEVRTEVEDDGTEYSQNWDVNANAPVGERWRSGLPPRPEKQAYTTITELDAEGNTIERTVPVEEAVAAGSRKTKPPAAETSDTIPFAKMPSENRVKLGLLANATHQLELMRKGLFNDKGEFMNKSLLVPRGAAGIASAEGREGLMNALRATSGANTPEDEIAREVDAMIPVWTDTDAQAAAKMARAENKINSLYAAVTEGFEGVPESLGGKKAAPAAGMPSFNTAAEAKAAMASGVLRKGDKFMTPEGVKVVP